jgi:hypothetical protein
MSAAFTQPPVVGVPSSEACGVLRRSYRQLYELVHSGKIAPPALVAGRFVWTAECIEAARQALGVDRRRREHKQAAGASGVA